jgi:hypothetical protein
MRSGSIALCFVELRREMLVEAMAKLSHLSFHLTDERAH